MHEAGLDRFAAWLIHKKAKGLVGEHGFRKSDLDDIKQELTLDLLQRLRSFDPRRAQYHTFVAMVVEHGVATLLEHRTAAMRDYRREQCSLNEPVRDDEGKTVERSETVSVEDDTSAPPSGAAGDLKVDLRAFLDSLPPALRSLALARQRKSVAEIARERGVPRTSLYTDLRRLKAACERAGLGQYLGKK
jgi:RNA polymerase sigma-70 factor (ECF subfamily)